VHTLGNLLWACFGINREDGSRTAPSAHNWQEIDIYAALPEGLYVYDAKAHALELIAALDLRAATGMQDFVATAPLNLVYVADLARMNVQDRREQRFYFAADAGFIAQNVYLFCASEGIATVVRGLIDRLALATAMRLRPDQRIILAQTVGYPLAGAP
jgi:SagB-type dehydrogenase family enzyme